MKTFNVSLLWKNWKQFRHSLQARLLFIILVITLTPLIILSVTNILQTTGGIEESVHQRLADTSKYEAEFIDTWASERMKNIETIALNESIQKQDADPAKAFLGDYYKIWSGFNSYSLVDLNGDVNISYSPPAASATPAPATTTSSTTASKPINVKDREYYQRGLNGESVISQPLLSKSATATNRPVNVIFSAPVYSEGKVSGVMAGLVSVQGIGDMLAKQNLGDTGESYLITRDGLVVTPLKYGQELIDNGKVKDSIILNYKLDTFAGQQIEAGQSGVSEYLDYRGVPVVGAYTWLPTMQLGLIVEQDKAEAMTTLNQILMSSITIIVIIAIILLVVMYFVSLSVSKPIRHMAEVADAIAEGKTHHQLNVDRKDEVGVLARSFQKIIDYQTLMADTAGKIATGDLTVTVQPKSQSDELGHSFVRMINHLRELISTINENSRQLSTASGQLAETASQAERATNQISMSMQQVAKGINQQADSISSTATSAEHMGRAIEGVARGAQDQGRAITRASEITTRINSAVQQVAGNARAVTEQSAEAAEAAREGSKTVDETLRGMSNIRTKVGVSAEKVREMGSRSDQIGAIVETIDDIASQTNLLALNAAIEAARAGEHGKGFAVVADEVRKLAEKSAGATKEIGGLIRGIQNTVGDAVKAMDDGAREVEVGVTRANQAGVALGNILKAAEAVYEQAQQAGQATEEVRLASNELVGAIDSVSAVVEENTASTEEMTASSTEVMTSVETIASVSEENSAAVEEVSASVQQVNTQVGGLTSSAEDLARMSSNLQQLVSQFTL
ncbi:MAG: methyl-accepting chemotaxis protein [Anaerolineae bacterium]|nr:methyl-accepting chemotaxis protein [Anaerolineae bacterium]